MRLPSQRLLALASLAGLSLVALLSAIAHRVQAESPILAEDAASHVRSLQVRSFQEGSFKLANVAQLAVPHQSGAKLMLLILRAQQAYRLENNTFASNIKQLDLQFDTQRYRLAIAEADRRHVIAKAIPKTSGLKSYAGGASQSNEIFMQIVCESNVPSQIIAAPVLRQGTWSCGKGSHRLPTPGAGKSSMGVILRAQQAYRLENNTFASNISQLDARLDTSDYHYNIVKADDNRMIATALPKTMEFSSYAGGAAQQGDIYKMSICESDRPSQTISLPYLQKGTWFCGLNSHPVN